MWILWSSFHRNEVPLALSNQKIQLLVAHPDDEVMFFAPTLIELSKEQYANEITVTCFSTGNAEGLGVLRAKELRRSLEILGIHHVEVIDDEMKFKDGMDIAWKADDIVEYLKDDTTMILTFDEGGVSNHPNHRSLYHAALTTDKVVVLLHTYPMWIKYSATLYTNWRLLSSKNDGLEIYSDWAGYLLALCAMISGHKSQMVWFRYGWLLFSNYINMNKLVVYSR
jgi:N-acetylglucosaminylphosphatidylinositol deacetylase